MIRPVLTEFALFLAPFVIYAIYLWATRAGVLHPESWPLPTLMWLTIVALLLMAGSFIVLAQWGGEPRRLELRAGAHRERQARAGDDEVKLDAPWLQRKAARATCSPCSTATARRRAWSAARCATRCSACRMATSTSRPRRCRAEVMRRAEAAGFKAVPTGIDHGTVTVVIEGRPFEVTTLARGRRDLRPPRDGEVRARLEARRASGATSP